jgi:hypothetical protein
MYKAQKSARRMKELLLTPFARRSALLLGLSHIGCGNDASQAAGFGDGSSGPSVTTITLPTSGAEASTTSELTSTTGDGFGMSSSTTGGGLACPVGLRCEETSGSSNAADSSGGNATEPQTGSESTDATTGDTGGSTDSTGSTCEPDVPDPACTLEENGLIFVSTPVNGGSDLNDGLTAGTPVSTLAHAIDLALACPDTCDVVVSAGVYKGSISLASGVSMFGGYAPGSFEYALAENVVEIVGTAERAVTAESIASETRVSGLTIRGGDFADGGTSSYALWIRNAEPGMLRLERSILRGGHGGVGANGTHGSDGSSGSKGGDAITTNSNSYGGSGGGSACGATGGDGGAAGCSVSASERDGDNGLKTPDGGMYGKGGPRGMNQCPGVSPDSGGNGHIGKTGYDGDAGVGGTAPAGNGSFTNGLWSGVSGNQGTTGKAGGGGGGGGAGGTDDDGWQGQYFRGGGGGGGGGGGCGGKPGAAGKPGGGSFGVVSINSWAEFLDSEIAAGDGGAGGKGGTGGNGGGKGGGGGGKVGPGEAGDGRDGGYGGYGGGAGGGSGGCGGASIGLVTIGFGEVTLVGSPVLPGTAGVGGSGGPGGYTGGQQGNQKGGNGAAGCSGVAVSEKHYD